MKTSSASWAFGIAGGRRRLDIAEIAADAAQAFQTRTDWPERRGFHSGSCRSPA